MAGTDKKSAYSLLGLSKGANEDQIKHAYINMVKKYDPEVHTERFMIIQNAFNRLKDPEKRAREDILTFTPMTAEYSFTDDEKAKFPTEKLDAAIKMLEEKRDAQPELTPKLIQVYFIRSWMNVQKGLHQEAMNDWVRVLEMDPTHQRAKSNLLCSYCRMGYSFASHNLFEEALEVWEKAAQMNPDNHDIIHNIALACELSGKHEQAIRFWAETLRRWKTHYDRNPTNEQLKLCIIEGHRHQSEIGKPEDGSQALAIAESAPATAPATASSANHMSPSRPAAQTTAQVQVAGKQRDELQAQKEILKLNPDDFDASFRIGSLLIEQKKWSEAALHLGELTRKYPRNIEVRNHLGWAQLHNQEVDLAFQTWKSALKLDPKNFQVRESLIRGYMNMGRALRDKNLFTPALVHLKNLEKMLPDSDEVHFELGKTYQGKGDFRSAYQEFQTVLKLNPKHRLARSSLSELKMRRA